MFKLSNVVDSLVPARAKENDEPFTWTTPIRHDPFLIAQLERANLELRTLFSIAAQARSDAKFDVAADVIVNCMLKLREVQRLEALRLYPVLAHHAANDQDAGASVAYLRLRTHTLARRFLRLSEGLVGACRSGQPSRLAAATFDEAAAVLDNYISAKELQLYGAYALAATAIAAA